MEQNNYEVPGAMRLKDLKNGKFQIHSKLHGAFEGDLNPIYWKAVKWGVSEKDLSYAIKELAKTGDDYAEFGTLGGFIYTARNK